VLALGPKKLAEDALTFSGSYADYAKPAEVRMCTWPGSKLVAPAMIVRSEVMYEYQYE
jgi:hypothetical protein